MFARIDFARHCRALLLVVIFPALFTLPSVNRSQTVNPPPGPTKLTAILAELAHAVPQDVSPFSTTVARPAMKLNREALPKAVRDALQTRMMRANAQGEVQVYVLMKEVSSENLAQLKANGVTVEIPDPDGHRVQARIPVSRLQAASSLPFVTYVRLPNYAVRMTGSVDTEGDTILKAQQARQQLGVDGSDVLVGVISDGIKGVFATGCTTCSYLAGGPMDPAKGDLPTATGTRNAAGVLTASTGGIVGTSFQANGDLEGLPSGACGFAGAGAEGTALLEIIHDMAPGAILSFANADTDLAFNQAVSSLAANNDIVTDDLGFFGLPQDGTSTVSTNTANALNSSTNIIRGYYTAVGNMADVHYYGAYTDSQTDGFSITGQHGDLHRFQGNTTTADTLSLGPQTYNEIYLQGTTSTGNTSNGGEVVVILSWDDAFGSSTNTFNLFLVQHGTTNVVASDIGKQCEGPSNPVACLQFVNNGSADTYYDILIQNPNNASAAKNLNLFAITPECAFGGLRSLSPSRAKINFNTPGRSVIAESDAGGSPNPVVSVGAICSATTAAQQASTTAVTGYPDPSCQDTTNSTIEYFSSQGPTLDGRNKPDISGIDGVSITGAGSFENPFFGTSAATPHIAGIAALLLESKVCLLTNVTGSQSLDNVSARTELHDLLLDNADPLSPTTVFGTGRANALASVLETIPVFSGPTSFIVGGNTPTGVNLLPADLGFAEPTTCPSALLTWTGGCGTPANNSTSMNCPFGTNNVSVAASNSLALTNPAFFSPAQSLQIVVTSFGVAASPGSVTVPAGQSAAYTVTASPSGPTFPNAVNLTCSNLPTAATCSFSPATITPGAAGAQSTLTVRTTARSLVPPAVWPPLNGMREPAYFRFFPTQLLWLIILLAVCAALGVRSGRTVPRTFSRRMVSYASLFILGAFLLALMACGGGGNNTPPPPAGTPAGTYTITITGTSGTLVETSTATLVVQ